MRQRLCGIMTPGQNLGLWHLCHEKLETLGFRCTHRFSVQMDATVIDLNERTFRDCWIDRDDDDDSLAYEDVDWCNAADLLVWDEILSEADALSAYAEMWRSGNCEKFVGLLSTNFTFTSQFTLESLESKFAFERYIKKEMPAIRDCGINVVTKLGRCIRRPCLVFTLKNELERESVTVFATVLGGRITNICIGRVPRPKEVQFP